MAERELTPKQAAFALAYFETANATEAYRRAYDVAEPMGAGGLPERFYVYALIDPSCGTIFYVGKGKGARMYDHMRDFAAGRVSGVKKYRGIKVAIEQGRQIEPFCIEHNMTESVALRFERALIHRIGHERLWNALAGQVSSDERAKAQAEAVIDKLTSLRPLYSAKQSVLAEQFIGEMKEAIALADSNLAVT